MIPAAHHGGGYGENVSHGLNCVAFADFVSCCPAGVSGAIFAGRMFAWGDWDNQLALSVEIRFSLQIIFLSDSFWRRAVGSCDRTERISGRHLVVTPPNPHFRRNGFNRAEIKGLGSWGQMQLELQIFRGYVSQQRRIQL